MIKRFTFAKELETTKWFVVLPDWPGSKEDLEMVSGADVMLEILAQGEDSIRPIISTEPFEGCDTLELLETPEYGGGIYWINTLNGITYEFEIWLCNVTKFALNCETMPYKIYIKA